MTSAPRSLSALAVALFAPLPAVAHPGHGDPSLEGTALHYLAEPAHYVVLAGRRGRVRSPSRR